MIKVHAETYRKEGEDATVDVTFEKDRRTLRCFEWNGLLTIYGLAVKYPTGEKVWSGSATARKDDGIVTSIRCNGMDRRTRHNQVRLVGFYEKVAEAYRSQHAGN